jgi:hypothetical protein
MEQGVVLDRIPTRAALLMKQCWHGNPENRPTGFDQIQARMKDLSLALIKEGIEKVSAKGGMGVFSWCRHQSARQIRGKSEATRSRFKSGVDLVRQIRGKTEATRIRFKSAGLSQEHIVESDFFDTDDVEECNNPMHAKVVDDDMDTHVGNANGQEVDENIRQEVDENGCTYYINTSTHATGWSIEQVRSGQSTRGFSIFAGETSKEDGFGFTNKVEHANPMRDYEMQTKPAQKRQTAIVLKTAKEKRQTEVAL